MANWANDLARGFGQGASIDATIDQTAERRKKAKLVGTVDSEMKSKLFDVEDKGALGNWMYNKFGIGDPPQLTNKAGAAPAAAAAPAAEPTSDARSAAAAGTPALLASSAPGPAPEQMPMNDIAVTPVPAARFAAATPLVATQEAPQMSSVTPQLSATQKLLKEIGIS